MFDVADVARRKAVDVGYANPQAFFHGKAVCGSPETIHGVVTDLTTSDNPKIDWPFFTFGTSAQSFHPKVAGAGLYADTLGPSWHLGPVADRTACTTRGPAS